jgi:hypothetical protein
MIVIRKPYQLFFNGLQILIVNNSFPPQNASSKNPDHEASRS